MTVDLPPPPPRVVVTRRYEFTLPGSSRVVDFDELRDTRDRALAWLRAQPLELDPADVVVRYAHDHALVVSYSTPPRVESPTSPTVGPSTLVTDVLETQRFQLAEALDVADDVTWDYLLDVARNRTALTNVAARAVTAVNGGPEPLVLALLPRDWPRQLDRQVPSAGNLLALVTLIKRLVDDWVLAATDVVDAARVEPFPLRTTS